MSVAIYRLRPGSIAEKKRLRPGDLLISINGNPINDLLDLDFYAAEPRLTLELEREGRRRTVRVRKEQYADLGLEFETYLIDQERSCRNGCIFCFVDQMPPGMRESLYFKDDDARLSFLFGNYITLTNLSEQELDRIIRMHISPINVSVHTTNPALRVRMMRNRFAGEALGQMKRLAQAGIRLNCQLVLCPGVNDGPELTRSLEDLGALWPSVQSVACVPVGLTRYREGLCPLRPYDKAAAGETIDRIERFSEAFLEAHGTRLAYPSDELFLKAERPLPEEEYYEDFSQLENGVGVVPLLMEEFRAALADLPESGQARRVSLATGTAAAPFLRQLVKELQTKRKNLECTVIPVENRFFGESINVAGLVTGRDLLAALEGLDLGEALLLPSVMLRHEQDRFLDDVTLEELRQKAGVPVEICEIDGAQLLAALKG